MKRISVHRVIGVAMFLILFLLSFLCFNAYSITFDEAVKKLETGEFDNFGQIAESFNEPAQTQLASLYHFYKGNYPSALEELKKIQIPKETSVDSNLHGNPASLNRYLTKLLEITTGFSEYSSANFNLHLTGTDKVLSDSALESLEKIREKIGIEFDYFPEDKILVEIYPDKESFAFASTLGDETLERSGAIGICKFNRIMIVSPGALPQGYRWIDALCHEYVHFVVNRVTKGNCSLWLHEGIARYHDTIWRASPPLFLTPGNKNLLFDALKENRLISFKSMSPSLVYLKNQDEVSLAFAEVSNAVEYIKREYEGGFIRLLRALQNKNENESFKEAFGTGVESFEKKWTNNLRKYSIEITTGAVSDRIYWKKYDEVDAFVSVSARDYIRLGDRFRLSLSPEKGAFDLALSEYEKALRVEPNNPVILLKAAKMYFSLGKSSEAVSSLLLCIEKNPNYVSAYELLGEWYLLQKSTLESIKYLKEALAINPYNPLTHINIAKSYILSEDRTNACREFKNALILDPQNVYLARMVEETCK